MTSKRSSRPAEPSAASTKSRGLLLATATGMSRERGVSASPAASGSRRRGRGEQVARNERMASSYGGWPARSAARQRRVPPAHLAGVLEGGVGELDRRGARVRRGAAVVPVQDVLALTLVPAGRGGGEGTFSEAGRRRGGEGVERCLRVPGIPRPPADRHHLGVVGVASDEIVGARVGRPAGEHGHGQVEASPPRVDGGGAAAVWRAERSQHQRRLGGRREVVPNLAGS